MIIKKITKNKKQKTKKTKNKKQKTKKQRIHLNKHAQLAYDAFQT